MIKEETNRGIKEKLNNSKPEELENRGLGEKIIEKQSALRIWEQSNG